MSNVQVTIDQRIAHINELTGALKQAFFAIAEQMQAIKDYGNFKNVSEYLAFMEKETGYKRTAVGRFLRAHRAMNNLIDFCEFEKAPNGVFPETEAVIRPLATKKLNEDPEKQAAIWERVVEKPPKH